MLTEGPSTTRHEPQAALRRDIRELGVLLGRTIVRQEGREMLELVERVRQLVRTDREAAAAILAEADPLTAIRLVRASRPTSTWPTWPSRSTARADRKSTRL